jgi:hypothetical protein
METSQPLARGEVSVTAAGGAGSTVFDATVAGLGVRLGVGLGRGHELRVEGTGAESFNVPQDKDHPQAWFGHTAAWGYKLSWKYAPVPWFALIVGGGGSVSGTGLGVGGDVALLFSRPRGELRPYVGTRATIGVPVGRPIDDSGGVTPALVQAAGLAVVPKENVRIYVEGGLLVAGSNDTASSTGTAGGPRGTHVGGYGGMGLELRFGHRNL